ncbi:MAG TPA: protein kinase [Kineosporiaceae bacterium]|nr:protein kinase [Kineosporiaceae bacterium]
MTQISADMVLGGRYRLRHQLARGGMADVWEGSDLLLDRTVAVKILSAGLAVDDAFRARFREEARTAGRLSHPGIAAVYDFGEVVPELPDGTPAGGAADTVLFLVMELVPGHSLAELLLGGSVDTDRALDYLVQAARALEVAHRNGIVHRDIKPANLMVTPQQQVKVTDFGIARRDGYEPLTATGKLVGTPDYLAPELSRGSAASVRSDVYALGVVAYECLAGRRPFAGADQIAVMAAHVEQQVPPLPPDLAPEPAAAVLRALEKDPQRRFASAAQFADALDRVRVAGAAPGRQQAAVAGGVGGRPVGTASPGWRTRAAAATVSLLTPPGGPGRPRTADLPLDPWASGLPDPDRRYGPQTLGDLVTGPGGGGPQDGREHGGQGGSRRTGMPVRRWVTLASVLLLAGGAYGGFGLAGGSSVLGRLLRSGSTGASGGNAGMSSTRIPSGAVTTAAAVTVPDETRVALGDAERELRARGLVIGDVVPADSPDLEVNHVLGTDPAAGASAAPGTRVRIHVSSGRVTVPDVTGEPVADALVVLQNRLHLQVVLRSRADGATTGTVVAQDITGSGIPKGSPVTLTVSAAGPREIGTGGNSDGRGQNPGQGNGSGTGMGGAGTGAGGTGTGGTGTGSGGYGTGAGTGTGGGPGPGTGTGTGTGGTGMGSLPIGGYPPHW